MKNLMLTLTALVMTAPAMAFTSEGVTWNEQFTHGIHAKGSITREVVYSTSGKIAGNTYTVRNSAGTLVDVTGNAGTATNMLNELPTTPLRITLPVDTIEQVMPVAQPAPVVTPAVVPTIVEAPVVAQAAATVAPTPASWFSGAKQWFADKSGSIAASIGSGLSKTGSWMYNTVPGVARAWDTSRQTKMIAGGVALATLTGYIAYKQYKKRQSASASTSTSTKAPGTN